jgi:hypothetical protein
MLRIGKGSDTSLPGGLPPAVEVSIRQPSTPQRVRGVDLRRAADRQRETAGDKSLIRRDFWHVPTLVPFSPWRTTHMPSRRTKTISIKVTDDEYATFTHLAAGQTVSTWVHEVVVTTASPRPADQVLLAEFLAVRTILLNLHFAALSGETPTENGMKRLIARVDAEKIRKAQEHLAALSPRRTP